MSAFDDEFGLFGEETESERRSRLPGRRIASGSEAPQKERHRRDSARRREERPRRREASAGDDPWARPRRATELLEFLAKRLVSNSDAVRIELFLDEEGEPVIELIVDPEDLGKVIGRNGRVAQALRTLARATAESPVAVDILDTEEAQQPLE
jgi:predicted RNA-binding protein YlqC (UPF0109 family)